MPKTLKFISKIFAIFAIIFATSCSDDDDFSPVVIESITSDHFYPGEDVILTGRNFDDVLFTFLENNQVPFQLEGDSIIFMLPESSAIGNTLLTLVMADGYTVTADIEVVARPFPIIQAVSPNIAEEGAQVTITGTSLNNLISVTIGEVEASVVSSTATELIVTVPAGLAQNVPTELKVVTNGGEAVPTLPFYVGTNLLLNGDLELGSGDDFNNWGKWNGGDGMTATTASGEAYYGRSLRAEAAGGNPWNTQFVSDPAPTEVGSEYTLFMYIKAQPGTPGDGGNIRFSTNPDALYSGNYDITGEWQQIEWSFVANTTQTRAVLDLGVVAGAVYFVDNITLIKTGTPPPPPINTNGSFEDSDLGAADNIAGWGGLNGNLVSGEITDVHSHDGDKSLKLTINDIGANPWDIQPTSSMTVVDGETYHLSVWFKGNGITNIKIAIDQGGDPGWLEWAAPEQGFLDNEWTEISYDFTADTTNSSDGNARFAISMSYSGNVGGVIYIDDLEVTPAQ
ncbi:carbohydrate binding domain-containing protein [Mangrovimonas sp. YM274]|uniref:carbohydrate binding domain-containing protein n=1 Tax=Mangrovimonas sp. YM274 TaxID=3070660 RepID=UPI0027DDD064|nr:carbohydrate binding domain-containing protein [Mangrovimonas sp. YM274]WMI67744.1 carbohydrate binding domain-containing protein [Mangrovimonas sp. YM274]